MLIDGGLAATVTVAVTVPTATVPATVTVAAPVATVTAPAAPTP